MLCHSATDACEPHIQSKLLWRISVSVIRHMVRRVVLAVVGYASAFALRATADKSLTHPTDAHPSNTASAPFTASALSVTVFSSDPACTVMFSAKNRATVT